MLPSPSVTPRLKCLPQTANFYNNEDTDHIYQGCECTRGCGMFCSCSDFFKNDAIASRLRISASRPTATLSTSPAVPLSLPPTSLPDPSPPKFNQCRSHSEGCLQSSVSLPWPSSYPKSLVGPKSPCPSASLPILNPFAASVTPWYHQHYEGSSERLTMSSRTTLLPTLAPFHRRLVQ